MKTSTIKQIMLRHFNNIYYNNTIYDFSSFMYKFVEITKKVIRFGSCLNTSIIIFDFKAHSSSKKS